MAEMLLELSDFCISYNCADNVITEIKSATKNVLDEETNTSSPLEISEQLEQSLLDEPEEGIANGLF